MRPTLLQAIQTTLRTLLPVILILTLLLAILTIPLQQHYQATVITPLYTTGTYQTLIQLNTGTQHTIIIPQWLWLILKPGTQINITRKINISHTIDTLTPDVLNTDR